MPVRYDYNAGLQTIEIVCEGRLEIGEIRQYFIDVAEDASIPEGAVEIVDLNGVDDFSLTSTDASDMPARYRRANRVKRIRGTLLVGASDGNFGMGRMIQAYFNHLMPDHVFEVVRTRREAERRLQTLR